MHALAGVWGGRVQGSCRLDWTMSCRALPESKDQAVVEVVVGGGCAQAAQLVGVIQCDRVSGVSDKIPGAGSCEGVDLTVLRRVMPDCVQPVSCGCGPV